jgi:hypothetical protein
LADAPQRKVTDAPPWLAWLLTPLIARNVARAMARDHPGLSPDEIVAKMRADLAPNIGPPEERLLAAVRRRLPRQPGAENEGTPVTWHSPSSLLLVAANLVPLWGVLAWDWPVFPLLVLFWAENVVVGVLNVARMLAADPGDLAMWGSKLFLVPFFCVHYGAFTAGHGTFVFGFFGGKEYDGLMDGLDPRAAALKAAVDYQLWLPLAILAGSHLFSFAWNYLHRGEYLRTSVDDLMTRPYKRVIVLHVTIILGGMGTMALGSPFWALLLLVGLKTWLDLWSHLNERRAMQ